MWLVVGLGNPGSRYDETRHNAGFIVVDRLADRWGLRCDKKQLGALVGDGVVRGQKTLLVQPQQYMNRSGLPVRSLQGYYKVPTERVVVIHDDVDLPFGQIRVKQGGGHGGHNGLRDLHAHLDGPGYARVRFGVGRPPEGWDTADYVLGKWTPGERDTLADAVDQAADAVELVLEQGPLAAMNTFNIRKKRSEELPAPKGKGDSQQTSALAAEGAT